MDSSIRKKKSLFNGYWPLKSDLNMIAYDINLFFEDSKWFTNW